MLRSLDAQRVDTARLRVVTDPVKENRLPNSPQAHHENALRRTTDANPLQSDPNGLSDVVTTGKLGRRRPSSRSKRVLNRIHGRILAIFA